MLLSLTGRIRIEKLGIEDLKFLNSHIANRLKQLYKMKQAFALMDFRPGQRVSFCTKSGDYKEGTIIRINQKTISLEVDNDASGAYWKVSPTLLKKLL